YNARAYGATKTLGRIVFDRAFPSERNGDVSFEWRVGETPIRVAGHVFTPAEMTSLFRDAGLRVVERFVVDYQTGDRRRFACEGQLLYRLVAVPFGSANAT